MNGRWQAGKPHKNGVETVGFAKSLQVAICLYGCPQGACEMTISPLRALPQMLQKRIAPHWRMKK